MKSINKILLSLITATTIVFHVNAEIPLQNKSIDMSNLGLKQTIFNNKAGPSSDQPKQIEGINDANIIAGRYIVVLDKAAVKQAMKSSRKRESVADFLNNFVSSSSRSVYMDYVQYFDDILYAVVVDTPNQSDLDEFLNNPLVDYIQVDQVVKLEGTQTNPTWGLDRVDQDDLPLDNFYNFPNKANSVNAYVIDSGINENHSDFVGRVLTNLDFYVEPPFQESAECCLTEGNTDNSNSGHGTHVMGTIGGTTYGVAKKIKLHSIKIFNESGTGSTLSLISALNWVKQNQVAPAVLNMSLSATNSRALTTVLTALQNSGIIMVAAAGNAGINACGTWPAAFPGVIAVGSTDSSDKRSGFSNTGPCVDIFAPGSNIISASNTNNNGNKVLSGTSMASPHVTGAVAQYLHQNPNASFTQVKTALVNTATQGTLTEIGAGSPNLMLNVPALLGVIDEYAPDEFDNVAIRGYDDDIAGNAVSWPGTTQGADYHNFHDQGDEDWTIVYFSGSGRIYTEALGTNAATTLEVYKWISADLHPSNDGRFINIVDEEVTSDMSAGNSEVIVHAHEPAVYAVRVRSYNNASGVGTEYKLNMVGLESSTPDEYDNVPFSRAYDDDSEGQSVYWSGSTQVHNFHDAGDEDWTFVYFSGFAKFSTILYGDDADTTLEVFKWISADEHPAQDGRFINIVSVPVGEDFSPGSSTVYVDAEVPDVYAVRVKSRGNVHGSTTTYALKLEAL